MGKWNLVKSKEVLESAWIKVKKNIYQLPSGKEISDYYIVERDDFVLVVAYERDQVVLVRQYRPATEKTYISLPAGYIQHSEKPEITAARELEEETGLRGNHFSVVAELHPLPGYIKSRAYVVVCKSLKGNLTPQDNEEIETAFMLSWEEILKMIREGQILEMQAVSALLLVKNFLDKSQKKYCK